jgi:DNA-binding FadR family transcriptional regulator
MYESADLDDAARQVEEDYKFHRMICEMAGSSRLLRLFDDLASELRMVIGLIGRLYDDPRRIAQTHEAVLDALVEGHPDIINARIDYHIGAAWHQVAALVRDIPHSSNGVSS